MQEHLSNMFQGHHFNKESTENDVVSEIYGAFLSIWYVIEKRISNACISPNGKLCINKYPNLLNCAAKVFLVDTDDFYIFKSPSGYIMDGSKCAIHLSTDIRSLHISIVDMEERKMWVFHEKNIIYSHGFVNRSSNHDGTYFNDPAMKVLEDYYELDDAMKNHVYPMYEIKDIRSPEPIIVSPGK